LLQLSAIPIQQVFYQPIAPVPPVSPVKKQAGDGEDGQKPRATPPPGVGSLLDIEV
jgi:hypothetical protein